MSKNKNKDAHSLRNVLLLVFVVVIISLAAFALFISGKTNFIEPTPMFNPSCYAAPGYSCNYIKLNANGTLYISISQTTQMTEYNFGILCLLSNSTPSQNTIDFLPIVSPLRNGQALVLAGLPCYYENGSKNSGIPSSGRVSGYVWLNYTQNDTAPSIYNPYTIVKAFTISVNAT